MEKSRPLQVESHPTEHSVRTNWITGELARSHVQELRHQHDAILVGVGTVIADDPLLTDRSGHARRRPLLRVVLDSRLRLPLESRVVKTAADDVLVLCSFAEEKKKKQLLKLGVRVEQLPTANSEGHPEMAAVLRFLGQTEITSLMIEGGSMVNAAALSAGIVDKVFLYYAPRILGGTTAVPFAGGAGIRNHQQRSLRKIDPSAPLWRRFRSRGILERPVCRLKQASGHSVGTETQKLEEKTEYSTELV